MSLSLSRRVTLRELMEQAWQQIEGQARDMLKRAVEGLLIAERDRRVAEAKPRGEKVYRWGYTVRKCWTTLWGNLEQVRVPRLRGWEEIGLVERYERHSLDEVLFSLTVGGLSQRKVVGWVQRFLGGTLSPATIRAVLEQAQQQVEQRRNEPIPPGRYRALVVDGIYLRYRRRVSRAARAWARRFCARWRWAAPEMVEKFQAELPRVLAFFAFPAPWRHRLRTTNLGEGWFKHLRRYLSRFPGCRDAEHSEQVLGCFLLAAEQMHR